MNKKKELDQKLLEACTADNIDLACIERLLKDGANPLGCVEDDDGDNNLYDVVLYHFLDLEQADKDDSDFFKITELFLKYGMDISQPEIAYDPGYILNPLWGLAFFSSETARRILRLFLDHGLDADSARECWGHKWSDLWLAEFTVDDDFARELAIDSFQTVMLVASYPHILEEDSDFKRVIWFDENDYDTTMFRSWDNYKYVLEPTVNRDLRASLVRIFDKATKKEVWRFGFELSPEEWKSSQTV